jgi:hypothetical protein
MIYTGGILEFLTRSPLSVPDRESVPIVDVSKVSEKDVTEFLAEVFKPDTKPHFIYLPEINVSVRKDKPGMCADGFTGEYRSRTEEEEKYIHDFFDKYVHRD